jgi:hypothetical protein
MMTTLEQAIGQQMRRLREANGVRQETVAAGAKMWSLPWTQATVAAIELGQRGLSIGEFVMLPLVFGEAGICRPNGRDLDLEDFVPEYVDHNMANVPVVPNGYQMPLRIVRALLRGGLPPASVRGDRGEAGPGEAERKVARKLGCSTVAVVAAARGLWGRTLSEERDGRIGKRAKALDRRSLQAVRGRVTRALVKELAPNIKRRK